MGWVSVTGSHTPQDQSPGRETEAGPPPLEWQPEGPGTERPTAQWTQGQPRAAGRGAMTKRKGPERPPSGVEGGHWGCFIFWLQFSQNFPFSFAWSHGSRLSGWNVFSRR